MFEAGCTLLDEGVHTLAMIRRREGRGEGLTLEALLPGFRPVERDAAESEITRDALRYREIARIVTDA